MSNLRHIPESEMRLLYERYAPIVHARCRMILKSEDDAWDATQEVFIRLLRSLNSIEKKESVLSWLLSTSTNFCISALRKKQGVEFNEEVHGKRDDVPQQERQLLRKEIMKLILGPWDSITRQIVVYTYIDGYKQEEIARITGMGESTIRKYLTRFRRKAAQSGVTLEEVVYG